MRLPSFNTVVSSAAVLTPRRDLKIQYDSWQDQLWDYYDRIGEYEAAVAWRSNSISRIRLVAAEITDTGDEPTPLEEGPAADAVARLAGGTGGQAQLLRELTVHLDVPGEGWLVGEETSDGVETWFVASADELRQHPNKKIKRFQLRTGEERNAWRTLPANSLVVRVWNPHPRFGWRPVSSGFHAMSALLELDMINKRIVAEIISRLASNGVILYDKDKLSLPNVNPPPEGADQVDPLAEVFAENASIAIKDPASASAVLPLMLGMALGDMTTQRLEDLFVHVKLTEFLDDKLIAERESAVKRLAKSLDMPTEILTGVESLNHWSLSQLEESGIKVHIAPTAELIVHSLTTGYLIPTLQDLGEPLTGPNGGRVVIWYDPSDLVTRPDLSANALNAYDRFEITGDSLRRHLGLPENDAPDAADLRGMITKFLSRAVRTAPSMLENIGGPTIDTLPGQGERDVAVGEGTAIDTSTAPSTRGDPAPRDPSPPDRMSVEELEVLAAAVEDELDRRRPAGSRMYEAGAFVPSRVTPVRRNGSKSVE